MPPPPLPPRPSPRLPPRPAASPSRVFSNPIQPYNPQDYSKAVQDLSSDLGRLDVNSRNNKSAYQNGVPPVDFEPPPLSVHRPRVPEIRSHEYRDTSSPRDVPNYAYSSVPEALTPSISPPPLPFQPTSSTAYHQRYPDPPRSEVKTPKSPSQAPVYEPPLDIAVPISQLAVKHNSSRDFLRECPNPDAIQFSARWYYPSCAPKFLTCSNCYEKTIRPARRCEIPFESFVSGAGEKMSCVFGTPRVESLWKRAIETNDWRDLKTFMQHRAAIPNCYGMAGTNGTTGVKWFTPAAREIEGFVSCQACYEDHILATTFGGRFKPHSTTHAADQIWACDIAVKHIGRALKHYSDLHDWHAFIGTASRRLKVAACSPYTAVPSESTKWYQPKGPLPNFIICEACFLDLIADSSMATHFQRKPEAEVQQATAWTCTMGYLPMSVAFTEAARCDIFRLWFECARVFVSENLCTGKPIEDAHASWYRLKDSACDFDICRSCHACLIEAFGFEKYFIKADYRAGGSQHACDFFPGRHAFAKYMAALEEAITTDQFAVLRDFIEDFEGVLPCLRSEVAKGRNFYGNADFSCCAECYRDVIRGTRLDARVTARNQYHEMAVCHMYSPRMRGLWADACSRDDYESFASFARHRSSVYLQTVPICRQLLQQQQIALMQQRMLNTTSSFYNSLDRSSSLDINYTGYPTTKYTYTAPDVSGSFGSRWGVDGARYGQMANKVVFDSWSVTAKVRYLEDLWREVE